MNPQDSISNQPNQDLNQPIPASAPQPQQPVAGPVPVAPAPQVVSAQAAPTDANYTSNPFLVGVSGLITILQNNPVAAMLSTLAVLLSIAAIYLVIILPLSLLHSTVTNILAVLIGVVVALVVYPLAIGVNYAVAGASLKEKTISTKEAISETLKRLLPFIGLIILMLLGVGLGLFLLIIPGIIFAVRAALAPVILFEEGVGPVAAIKQSFALTKGHFFETFSASVAGAMLSMQGLLSFAVMVAPMVGRYQQLKALKASGAQKPKVHWLNYFIPGLIAVVIASYVGLFVFVFSAAKHNSTLTPSTDFNSSSNYNYDNSTYYYSN